MMVSLQKTLLAQGQSLRQQMPELGGSLKEKRLNPPRSRWLMQPDCHCWGPPRFYIQIPATPEQQSSGPIRSRPI